MKIKKTIEVEVKVNPCIKCGSDDIRLWNCNYSSFNKAGAICSNCEHKVSGDFDYNVPQEELIEFWNNSNNPLREINDTQTRIKKLEEEVERLKGYLRQCADLEKST